MVSKCHKNTLVSFEDIYGKPYLLLNDGEQLQSVIVNLLLHK